MAADLIAQRAVRRAGFQRAEGPWEEGMPALDAHETRDKRDGIIERSETREER